MQPSRRKSSKRPGRSSPKRRSKKWNCRKSFKSKISSSSKSNMLSTVFRKNSTLSHKNSRPSGNSTMTSSLNSTLAKKILIAKETKCSIPSMSLLTSSSLKT